MTIFLNFELAISATDEISKTSDNESKPKILSGQRLLQQVICLNVQKFDFV